MQSRKHKRFLIKWKRGILITTFSSYIARKSMGRQRNGNRTVNSEWDGVFFMGLARYFYLFWAAWSFSNQSELTDVMYNVHKLCPVRKTVAHLWSPCLEPQAVPHYAFPTSADIIVLILFKIILNRGFFSVLCVVILQWTA